jgi:hypothetical protein
MSTDANLMMTFTLNSRFDRNAAATIESTVRGLDREALVRVSAGLVSVRSRAPAGEIRAALKAAGLDVEPTNRPFPREPARLPIVGWTLIGAIITPIITFLLVLAALRFDPGCGAPGDSGGCDMDLASLTILSVLPGAAIGFLFAITRGWWSAWRRAPARHSPSEMAAD